MLTSHINPTSVNLKRLSVVMMSGKWDFALFLLNGGLPDFSAPFIISQMTSEKRLYHFYTHDLDNIRYFSDPCILLGGGEGGSWLAFLLAKHRNYMCNNGTLVHAHRRRHFFGHFLKTFSCSFFFQNHLIVR